jgi:putative membrane protein
MPPTLLAQAWWCGPFAADGSWWWIAMPLGMLAFWALVIGLVVWGIRRFAPPRSDRPLEVVRERYARGEISREEYEHLRADLERSGTA